MLATADCPVCDFPVYFPVPGQVRSCPNCRHRLVAQVSAGGVWVMVGALVVAGVLLVWGAR